MTAATATYGDVLKGTDPKDTQGNRQRLIDAGWSKVGAYADAVRFKQESTSARRSLLAQRVSLGSLLRDGIPEATFIPSVTLGERLFYEESVWIVSGHPKSGKSWAVAATALDCVAEGRPVVYIDFENRSKRFARRLLTLGADPDAVDALFHYIELPRDLTLESLSADLAEIAEQLPGALVVVDSLRGLMARLSAPGRPLDPNAAQDVEAVCAPLNEAAAAGLTVGVIDHAKKTATSGDTYSTSGSQAKEAAVDAVYYWDKREDFSKSTAGLVTMSAKQDRDGELDFERHWRIGGQGEGALRFERVDADEVGSKGRVREQVLDVLQAREGDRLMVTDVRKNVKGRSQDIGSSLDVLAVEHPHVFKDQGNRSDRFTFSYDRSRSSDPSSTQGLSLDAPVAA